MAAARYHSQLEELLTTYFAGRPEVQLARLFGSRARGTARPASDVDLAVLAAHALDADQRYGLSAIPADIAIVWHAV